MAAVGRQPVSIKDVAERAGVSPATVSNVVNRPERVATATRERVRQAIDETGYVANLGASRLRLLDNRAIGVLVFDVANIFHAELAKGAQQAAETDGFVSMLCDCDRSVDRALRQLDYLESNRVAGVLATGSSFEGVGERLNELRSRGVHTVLVDAPAQDADQCSVAVDDVTGGKRVGAHLIELGRQKIAYVKTKLRVQPFEDRLEGLKQAIAAHGGSVDLEVINVPLDNYDDGKQATDILLRAGCDAVFCANDRLALGVLRHLLARGVGVPRDVAVIGYDDTEPSALTAVPLSTVRQPARLVGQTAARLLLEECSDPQHVHQHIMFQPELVARQSTLGDASTAETNGRPQRHG